ncbi:uncharacterized protein LOC133877750 [Alnus glutinosa]|uniref:uncharacterized protein LOC133877750 n=1 Tax=Alnus glutinosa TaxID=3517 RepID=UPI002D770DD7|nr:uncharacterized protein LOC133877750 [Alnus glutinosa]XP_062172131.1 uncharacterized protein LOC133877750 [Alnus glutinosa]
MSREVLLRSTPANRRQPAPAEKANDRRRLGEMAGGTAAECAAVCCCCPCSVMNLLVLAVYKVPAGLCRKAWKQRKRHRLIKMKNQKHMTTGLLPHRPGSAVVGPTCAELEAEMKRPIGVEDEDEDMGDGGTDAVDLEKEMWDRFFAGGFWRSPSQRETS